MASHLEDVVCDAVRSQSADETIGDAISRVTSAHAVRRLSASERTYIDAEIALLVDYLAVLRKVRDTGGWTRALDEEAAKTAEALAHNEEFAQTIFDDLIERWGPKPTVTALPVVAAAAELDPRYER